MKDLLKVIAQGLVENPDAVSVEIGKQGRIAKAMRTVMRAAATRQDLRVSVEID